MGKLLAIVPADTENTYEDKLLDKSIHEILVSHLEETFAIMRPRLLRLARRCGVPVDSIEDIVQETYIAAWSHLDQIQASERLHAWLESICRNQCRMYLRKWRDREQRYLQLSQLFAGTEQDTDDLEAILPEQQSSDPQEELGRKEQLALLEQALAMLPDDAREILLRCDLAGQSQDEVATRLGISQQTLTVRRYRARQHLRRLLNGQLRTAAQACEFPLDPDLSSGWSESSTWCPACGQHRLRGIFEQRPDGGTSLRLRCPTCSTLKQQDILFYTVPPSEPLLHGRRTLGPALKSLRKHSQAVLYPYLLQALTTDKQQCLHCQQPVRAKLLMHTQSPPQQYLQVTLSCPTCGYHFSLWAGELACSLVQHPIIQQFFAQHPRWRAEPDLQLDYAGQPAYCFQMTDTVDSSRLTVLTHCETLQILSAFIER